MHHLQKHLSFLSIIFDRYIDMPDLLLTGQSCKKTRTLYQQAIMGSMPSQWLIKAKHLIQITQLVQTPLQSLLNTCCSLRLLRYTQHGPKLDSITPPKIIKNYYQKGYFPAEQTSITMLENVRPKKKGRVLLLLKQTSFLVIEKV